MMRITGERQKRELHSECTEKPEPELVSPGNLTVSVDAPSASIPLSYLLLLLITQSYSYWHTLSLEFALSR